MRFPISRRSSARQGFEPSASLSGLGTEEVRARREVPALHPGAPRAPPEEAGRWPSADRRDWRAWRFGSGGRWRWHVHVRSLRRRFAWRLAGLSRLGRLRSLVRERRQLLHHNLLKEGTFGACMKLPVVRRVAVCPSLAIGPAPLRRPRGRGGIGRRAGFRYQYRKMWGFESLRPHQFRAQLVRGTSEHGIPRIGIGPDAEAGNSRSRLSKSFGMFD